MVLLTTLGLEQTDEARLLEVMVCREGFTESALQHDHKARTIDQTPLLVRSLGEQLPRLGIKCRVYLHNVHVRRRFEPSNEGNDLGVRYPEWTHQKRHDFGKNVIRRDERVPLLPGTTIHGCGAFVIRLRGINKMAPAGSIRKNIRHLGDLQRCCDAWYLLSPSQGTYHGDLPKKRCGC